MGHLNRLFLEERRRNQSRKKLVRCSTLQLSRRSKMNLLKRTKRKGKRKRFSLLQLSYQKSLSQNLKVKRKKKSLSPQSPEERRRNLNQKRQVPCLMDFHKPNQRLKMSLQRKIRNQKKRKRLLLLQLCCQKSLNLNPRVKKRKKLSLSQKRN